MYNFTDTTEKGSNLLPKEAINVDGFFLDREISCFKTLTVSGREAISVSMDNYTIPKTDGIRVRDRRITERKITIKYSLNARDLDEYYSAMKKLKKHLYKEKILRIYFNDERDLYYEGYLSNLKEPNDNYYKTFSTIEITCPKPYKYHVNNQRKVINGGKISIDTEFPTKIKRIETGSLNLNSTNMTFNIGAYQMKFVGLPTTNGKKMIIDFEKLTISLGGQNITSNLDIMSDFGNIRLKDGDYMHCSLAHDAHEIIVDLEVYDL